MSIQPCCVSAGIDEIPEVWLLRIGWGSNSVCTPGAREVSAFSFD